MAERRIKEVRLRPHANREDLDFKLRQGRRFLSGGCLLQVTIIFRGREMARTDLGRALMKNVAGELADIAKIERPPRQEGRRLSAVFSPIGRA